jgi:hypothetical protein
MPEKKPTDLKSVSLDQINKVEGKLVVGGAGGGTESASTASKGEKDIQKMGGTLDKIERNPTPTGGSSSGRDSKSMDKDQAKREADGADDGADGVPDEISRRP